MSLEFTIQIAREAGAILREFQCKLGEGDIARKSSYRDLVTKADLAAERYLVEKIRKQYPDHAIFAEEEIKESSSDRPTWYIDPLDGTINFIHGHPHYAVSIALYEKGQPLLGVVFNPAIEELFSAQRGHGAHLNGRRLSVTPESELSNSLLATGFPYKRQELKNNNLDNFNRFFLQVRGIRRIGVASLDLAYVASGRFDGFWELHLQPYDVAAGALLVLESGGKVSDFSGTQQWLLRGDIIATNGKIHELIRAQLQG